MYIIYQLVVKWTPPTSRDWLDTLANNNMSTTKIVLAHAYINILLCALLSIAQKFIEACINALELYVLVSSRF